MLSGVISAIVGLAFLIAGATGGTGILGVTLSPLLAGIVGDYVVVFAVIEFGAGALAYRGHNGYGSMTGGILGLLGLVTLPLDLVGIVLVALGEGDFDSRASEEPSG